MSEYLLKIDLTNTFVYVDVWFPYKYLYLAQTIDVSNSNKT